MDFNTSMTTAERIAYLEGIVVLLHQSIHQACAVSEVDVDSIDLDNPDSWESLIYGEVNPTYFGIARHTIVRNIRKLNLVNKKLDELKNA